MKKKFRTIENIESEIIKFIKENNNMVASTRIRMQFKLDYYRCLHILDNMKKKKILKCEKILPKKGKHGPTIWSLINEGECNIHLRDRWIEDILTEVVLPEKEVSIKLGQDTKHEDGYCHICGKEATMRLALEIDVCDEHFELLKKFFDNEQKIRADVLKKIKTVIYVLLEMREQKKLGLDRDDIDIMFERLEESEVKP